MSRVYVGPLLLYDSETEYEAQELYVGMEDVLVWEQRKGNVRQKSVYRGCSSEFCAQVVCHTCACISICIVGWRRAWTVPNI